eukprot:1215219-Pyramimonas_sp.AAC.1
MHSTPQMCCNFIYAVCVPRGVEPFPTVWNMSEVCNPMYRDTRLILHQKELLNDYQSEARESN